MNLPLSGPDVQSVTPPNEAKIRAAARRVAVAGTFNQWDQNASPLVRVGAGGVWAITLALPQGHHQYAFVVDGAQWVPDPAAPGVDDGFGRRNSMVAVTARGARLL